MAEEMTANFLLGEASLLGKGKNCRSFLAPTHTMTPLVTLTTDFGPGSIYVAAMKGVLLSINPEIRLLDLSHQVLPQNLRHVAYFLRATLPFYPAEALHVVVVDPGVGTARDILYVELAGLRLLAPDNGCWTALLEDGRQPERVLRLAEPRYWRPTVSATFHGRDIFAPVAGHLSLGLDPALLGPPVDHWVKLELPQPRLSASELVGEIVFIDDFGNLISNIPGPVLRAWQDQPVHIRLGEQVIQRRVRTYGEAEPGTPVCLVSSVETVEIAVVQGHAARQLGAEVGTPLRLTLE